MPTNTINGRTFEVDEEGFFVNREGYLPDHRDYRVKLSGYWLLPYDFTIGFAD